MLPTLDPELHINLHMNFKMVTGAQLTFLPGKKSCLLLESSKGQKTNQTALPARDRFTREETAIPRSLWN